MSFFRTFLLICLLCTSAISNDNIPVKYIDLNIIVNNSVIGKKIKSEIASNGKKLRNEHQKIEKKLQEKKNEILSKKNVLSEEDFKKEVDKHQLNVNNYQTKKNSDLDKLNKDNLNMSKNFMVKVDKIVIDYSRENSIDLLLKKDALIVSNSNLDITKDILDLVNKNIKKID